MNLQSVITTIGIPAIALTLLYIGRKLQILDTLEKTVTNMYERFIKVEERVNTLWKDDVAPARSPRQLNATGNEILNNSGIKAIIENKKSKLLETVKELNPTNPYDAEQVILSVVADLPKHCPEVVEELKNGAFKVGQNLDTVLLVGGFHLRNLIFNDLGFSLTDLDKPKNSN